MCNTDTNTSLYTFSCRVFFPVVFGKRMRSPDALLSRCEQPQCPSWLAKKLTDFRAAPEQKPKSPASSREKKNRKSRNTNNARGEGNEIKQQNTNKHESFVHEDGNKRARRAPIIKKEKKNNKKDRCPSRRTGYVITKRRKGAPNKKEPPTKVPQEWTHDAPGDPTCIRTVALRTHIAPQLDVFLGVLLYPPANIQGGPAVLCLFLVLFGRAISLRLLFTFCCGFSNGLARSSPV